ncbi:MAG: TssQ family T6SS-associated lipoprotein [Betaproteobacteria bacterium]|nr:TssQ family T6SS-associated lipoprotein [Betaproteobacteria bacterium]
MQPVKLVVAIASGLVLLAGCASGPVSEVTNRVTSLFQGSKGEQALSAGIKQFEDGDYTNASKSLQGSLDLGLAKDSDKVKAHKYLAFIHCVSGRKRQCRDEFRKALDVIPSMELEAAEKGHPIWGPEFRSAKANK